MRMKFPPTGMHQREDVSSTADEKVPLNSGDLDPNEQARRLVANARIMMVDDEPLNMEVLKVHLEEEGYTRFSTISDSMQALEAIRRELPDVLLLDLVMPLVSGFDILTEMRCDEQLKSIPVIVLTSSNDAATKLTALQLGATDFLAKPVDASELALRMRNTLSAMAWQRRVSYMDVLTDLPNRLYFTSLLRHRLESISSQQYSLILVNIVRFKAINDSFGPDNGDQVMCEFRDRLLEVFSAGVDMLADSLFGNENDDLYSVCVSRIGGDRFAVCLPVHDLVTLDDQLTTKLHSFLSLIEVPFIVDGQDIYLDVSIGVSTMDSETKSTSALINDAETAMMHARRRTDTDFVFYSEQMDASARELLSMENGLRKAVDNGEIFLLYQPKIDVVSNVIVGAEALVRWQNPEFGLISPVHFIPIAEDNGMIVSIGEWVLRESCRQAVSWHNSGYPDVRIAVNVSIRQLHEPDFIDIVKSALHDSGLPAESLIVELTENMIMENAEANVVKLRRIKELGVKISIDDFGTGYSSLGYLQRFPLDQLKIDRSFISEIRSANEHVPIVKAVISLAHDLGLSVVAEGVETVDQLANIRAFNCEEYQGYLCSKPIPAEEFAALMAESRRKTA